MEKFFIFGFGQNSFLCFSSRVILLIFAYHFNDNYQSVESQNINMVLLSINDFHPIMLSVLAIILIRKQKIDIKKGTLHVKYDLEFDVPMWKFL